MWYGADFGKPKPQFSDAEQKLMNEVLELEVFNEHRTHTVFNHSYKSCINPFWT